MVITSSFVLKRPIHITSPTETCTFSIL